MPGNYHALAAVHHRAKAGVYARAGLHKKAQKHRTRAAWHASFGVSDDEDYRRSDDERDYDPTRVHDPVESPIEYDFDADSLRRAKREWDPHTADPSSGKFDPRSEYCNLLEEVRATRAYAPASVGSRESPVDLDLEDPEVVRARQRSAYRERALRTEDVHRARRELAEITKDIYDRAKSGRPRLDGRLWDPDLGRRLNQEDIWAAEYDPWRTRSGIEAKVASGRR